MKVISQLTLKETLSSFETSSSNTSILKLSLSKWESKYTLVQWKTKQNLNTRVASSRSEKAKDEGGQQVGQLAGVAMILWASGPQAGVSNQQHQQQLRIF